MQLISKIVNKLCVAVVILCKFFNLDVKINKCEVEISIFVLLLAEKIKRKNTLTVHSYFYFSNI